MCGRARACVCCFCICLPHSGDKYVVNLSADQTLSQRRDLDHMISRLRLSPQYPVHLQLITRSLSKNWSTHKTHTQEPRTNTHRVHDVLNPRPYPKTPKALTLIYQIHLAFAYFYKATVHFLRCYKTKYTQQTGHWQGLEHNTSSGRWLWW